MPLDKDGDIQVCLRRSIKNWSLVFSNRVQFSLKVRNTLSLCITPVNKASVLLKRVAESCAGGAVASIPVP